MAKAKGGMKGFDFTPVLDRTLTEIGSTKYKLAQESKVKYETISNLASGESGSVYFASLAQIIEALDHIAEENGIDRRFNVEDIFTYRNR